MKQIALSIAGSDPSGGAGIQADLKVFQHHGVYGTGVITLLTVQNTKGVTRVQIIEPQLMLEQLHAVCEDIPPRAVKTGALGNAEMIDALCFGMKDIFNRIRSFPLVIDPVMVSKHGSRLLEQEGELLLREKLLPLAHLVTPNIEEARILSERDIYDEPSMIKAARTISLLGVENVLVKGGHLETGESTDILFTSGGKGMSGATLRYSKPRLERSSTHGTGCSLSAAITANLAHGLSLEHSVGYAKGYLYRGIESAPDIGGGIGPINFFAATRLPADLHY